MAKIKKLNRSKQDSKNFKGTLIEVEVPTKTAKHFAKRINDDKVGGIRIWDKKENGDSTNFRLLAPEDVNMDSINIGFALNDQKYASAALAQAEISKDIEGRKAKGEKPKPISMDFSKSIRKEFSDLYSRQFKIVASKASLQGDKTTFYFDVSDCQTRQDLVLRIQSIMQAAQSCIENKRLLHDAKYCMSVYENLKDIQYMQTSAVEFEAMSGKELIKKGLANCFDIQTKPAKFMDRLLRFLFGKSKPELLYTYMNQVVDERKEYVVRCSEPRKLESSEPIDHKKEIDLRYDFGEQVASGQGVVWVEAYQDMIIKMHNQKVREQSKANE